MVGPTLRDLVPELANWRRGTRRPSSVSVDVHAIRVVRCAVGSLSLAGIAHVLIECPLAVGNAIRLGCGLLGRHPGIVAGVVVYRRPRRPIPELETVVASHFPGADWLSIRAERRGRPACVRLCHGFGPAPLVMCVPLPSAQGNVPASNAPGP